MTDSKLPSPLVRLADRGPEEEGTHPLNPRALVRGVSLSQLAGLSRVGLNFLRIPPGHESFAYHSHQLEEEFLYVLSGRALVEIDGVEHELGPGDFVGFPTPSAAHQLKNPFAEELVYLSGGERAKAEIADFPREQKRMIRIGHDVTIFPWSAGTGWDGKPKG